MNSEERRLIVGLDPGTTTGFAFLSLKGKVIRVDSGRELSTDRLIEFILEEGIPILIAADKEKVPSLIEEVASNFSAEVSTPEEDLSIQKKKELVEGHEVDNLHERDSLASAIYAFNLLRNKFRHIESRTDELGLPDLGPKIKELVVTGEADNISDAIEQLMTDEKEEKEDERKEFDKEVSKDELKKKIDNYRKNLLKERKDKEKIREYNENLKEKMNELQEQLEDLRSDYKELKRNKKDKILEKEEIKERDKKLRSKSNEAKKLRKENKEMSRKLEKLTKFEELRKQGKVPLRKVDGLSEEALRKKDRNLSLEDGVILAVKTGKVPGDIIDIMEDIGIRAVVGSLPEDLEDKLVSRGIWILPKSELSLKEYEGVNYIEEEILENSKKAEKGNFLSWLKRYRGRDV